MVLYLFVLCYLVHELQGLFLVLVCSACRVELDLFSALYWINVGAFIRDIVRCGEGLEVVVNVVDRHLKIFCLFSIISYRNLYVVKRGGNSIPNKDTIRSSVKNKMDLRIVISDSGT
jgi:hypothetical protein